MAGPRTALVRRALPVRDQHPPKAPELCRERRVTLKGAQTGVKRVDHGPAKVAMWKEAHSIAGAFLFQLTRNQIVVAAKHPREEGAGRWRAMRSFHVDWPFQEGCQL